MFFVGIIDNWFVGVLDSVVFKIMWWSCFILEVNCVFLVIVVCLSCS